MTALYEQQVERYARKFSDKGEVTLVRCGICGMLDWHSTDTEKSEFSYIVENMQEQGISCFSCNEVMQRNPEVFHWVLSVIAEQNRNE